MSDNYAKSYDNSHGEPEDGIEYPSGSAAGVPPLTKYDPTRPASQQLRAFIIQRFRDVCEFNGCDDEALNCQRKTDDPIAWCRYCLMERAALFLEQTAEVEAALSTAKAAYMDSVRSLGAELAALRGQLAEAERQRDAFAAAVEAISPRVAAKARLRAARG